MVQALGNSTSRRSRGGGRAPGAGRGRLLASRGDCGRRLLRPAPYSALRLNSAGGAGRLQFGSAAAPHLPRPPRLGRHRRIPVEYLCVLGRGPSTSGVWGMLELHSSQTHHVCALGNLPLKSWASLLLAGGFGT